MDIWFFFECLKVCHHSIKFGGHSHSGSRDNDFCLSHNFARPHDQNVMWLYGQEPFMISHHPTKCHGHRHCGSGDIIVWAGYVMSQGHILWVGAPQSKSPLCQVWWP